MPVVLADVFQFTRFMLQFQSIIRQVSIPGRDTKENDIEHSYQLAMMSWHLNQAGDWGLDDARLIRYALVHDIAEAYAGDIPIFHPDHAGKAVAEAAALKRIAAEFAAFPDLVSCITEYDRQDNDESRCIYALDKLMPMIMIYLEGGSTWRELDFDMEQLLANKADRIAGSPQVYRLHLELAGLVRRRPEMFNQRRPL
jgi:5'-deoxynucleotidase YfbR-like HD superfamily hydrolase